VNGKVTLAELGWRDKAIMIAIRLFGLWKICEPWFDARRREAAIARADNVELMRKVKRSNVYSDTL
jgi:hypothetical protein